jgi:hypothetical protein
MQDYKIPDHDGSFPIGCPDEEGGCSTIMENVAVERVISTRKKVGRTKDFIIWDQETAEAIENMVYFTK